MLTDKRLETGTMLSTIRHTLLAHYSSVEPSSRDIVERCGRKTAIPESTTMAV